MNDQNTGIILISYYQALGRPWPPLQLPIFCLWIPSWVLHVSEITHGIVLPSHCWSPSSLRFLDLGIWESFIPWICPNHWSMRALMEQIMSWFCRISLISALYRILDSSPFFTLPHVFLMAFLSKLNISLLSLSASRFHRQ